MILRRLGPPPTERETACAGCNKCPDLFELEGGDFVVIGRDVTMELIPHLPGDAGCGPEERIVSIPRALMVAARSSIPTQ